MAKKEFVYQIKSYEQNGGGSKPTMSLNIHKTIEGAEKGVQSLAADYIRYYKARFMNECNPDSIIIKDYYNKGSYDPTDVYTSCTVYKIEHGTQPLPLRHIFVERIELQA